MDSEGRVMGSTQGVESFTVGQRRGLGVSGGEPVYVIGIDAEKGRIVVGSEAELYSDTLWASDVSYTSDREPGEAMDITVKIRYKSPETEATLHPQGSHALVRFRQPQRAITPGQAVVFYRGDEVLGGGRISSDTRSVASADLCVIPSPSP